MQDVTLSRESGKNEFCQWEGIHPDMHNRRRTIKIRIDWKLRSEGAHPRFGVLSRRGWDQIKLAYNQIRPDSQLKLTSSAFNWLEPVCKQTSQQGLLLRRTGLAVSSPAVADTIASIHCTYPRRDGQAEWAWVAWMNTVCWNQPLKVVANLSTNRARRIA